MKCRDMFYLTVLLIFYIASCTKQRSNVAICPQENPSRSTPVFVGSYFGNSDDLYQSIIFDSNGKFRLTYSCHLGEIVSARGDYRLEAGGIAVVLMPSTITPSRATITSLYILAKLGEKRVLINPVCLDNGIDFTKSYSLDNECYLTNEDDKTKKSSGAISFGF